MKKRKCIECGESDIALTYHSSRLEGDKWHVDKWRCVCLTCMHTWIENCPDKQVKRKKGK